jgi:hypothetical protein
MIKQSYCSVLTALLFQGSSQCCCFTCSGMLRVATGCETCGQCTEMYLAAQ